MIVGGYTLDLYCDSPEHKGLNLESGKHIVMLPDGATADLQDSFAGRTERDCRKQAQQRGWRFVRGRKVICPFCNAAQEA